MTKDKRQRKKLGPATDQSGRPRSKFGGRGRFNNFELLPDNIKLEAERMLVNGATFEDTTEWINQRHGPEHDGEAEGVTLLAVRSYFQCNSDLQTRRVRRMQEVAQKLKEALAGDPHSAQAELADAVFLTGLMGLERAGSRFTVKDAARHFLARGSLGLKKRNLEAALRMANCDSVTLLPVWFIQARASFPSAVRRKRSPWTQIFIVASVWTLPSSRFSTITRQASSRKSGS